MKPAAPEASPHPYAEFLHRVTKPARYVGGEVGSCTREWTADVAKVCLAFPDVYDIGMSHLGFKILYKILNDDPRTLAERCYAPWVDLEAELRARNLPLVSLESKRPLKDFDVVGFSLQFELTFTNILTMLDLGGIPLRAADRGEDDPLVVAGGPVATHPEPIAPFLDAVVIGDGEEKATSVALTWKRGKAAGLSRAERLKELAKLGGVYVPSLYATAREASTGLHTVQRPSDPTLPFPVERSLVDISKYPFPDESPTGGPEAIFDRMSIEIARGCTEGCRFCQAGMIYRPVRERDPEQIVDTVLRAVEKSGQDEVSLTALSTADVSCISPLIKEVSERLAQKKISLGVSSLRAYGLDPELLDELKRVRGTGLTFAPEAGTQRMRDVINKNVTEEQLLETAERVFSRGWGKMKLYFICGLPTETDDDVRGIVQTGRRALEVGRRAAGKGKPAEVVVSVSVHVPKPHTPFQWCALDSLADIDRKQDILREEARKTKNLKLKTHDADGSVLEAIFARGDRRVAEVLERAWKDGARFDSWDDKLDIGLWSRSFKALGLDIHQYLGTLPIDARLPWSHIDVGLEDGFLAREYRKALQSRLSPPCGKVAGAFVHATTSEEAKAETKRLVCYDCGVACDMTKMREERIDYLIRLERRRPTAEKIEHEHEHEHEHETALPPVAVAADDDDGIRTDEIAGASLVQGTEGGGSALVPVPVPVPDSGETALGATTASASADRKGRNKPPPRSLAPSWRYRFWFSKLGPVALIGHLDLIREIPRVFRRVGVTMAHTGGFHPKPDMTFAPALSLGVPSLEEALDVKLCSDLGDAELEALCAQMTTRSPQGLVFLRAERLAVGTPSLSTRITGARYALVASRRALQDVLGKDADVDAIINARCTEIMAMTELRLKRVVKELSKMVDVRSYLTSLAPVSGASADAVRRAGFVGDLVGVEASVIITGAGAVKPSELAEVVFGSFGPSVGTHAVRLELVLGDAEVARAAAPVATEAAL